MSSNSIAVVGTLFLISIALFFMFSIKSGKIPTQKLKQIALMVGPLGILSGVLTLNSLILIIAPRVCGEHKDGMFGHAGGVLFGSSLSNVVLGAIVIGLFIGKK